MRLWKYLGEIWTISYPTRYVVWVRYDFHSFIRQFCKFCSTLYLTRNILWAIYDFHTLPRQFCTFCGKYHTLQNVHSRTLQNIILKDMFEFTLPIGLARECARRASWKPSNSPCLAPSYNRWSKVNPSIWITSCLIQSKNMYLYMTYNGLNESLWRAKR